MRGAFVENEVSDWYGDGCDRRVERQRSRECPVDEYVERRDRRPAEREQVRQALRRKQRQARSGDLRQSATRNGDGDISSDEPPAGRADKNALTHRGESRINRNGPGAGLDRDYSLDRGRRQAVDRRVNRHHHVLVIDRECVVSARIGDCVFCLRSRHDDMSAADRSSIDIREHLAGQRSLGNEADGLVDRGDVAGGIGRSDREGQRVAYHGCRGRVEIVDIWRYGQPSQLGRAEEEGDIFDREVVGCGHDQMRGMAARDLIGSDHADHRQRRIARYQDGLVGRSRNRVGGDHVHAVVAFGERDSRNRELLLVRVCVGFQSADNGVCFHGDEAHVNRGAGDRQRRLFRESGTDRRDNRDDRRVEIDRHVVLEIGDVACRIGRLDREHVRPFAEATNRRLPRSAARGCCNAVHGDSHGGGVAESSADHDGNCSDDGGLRRRSDDDRRSDRVACDRDRRCAAVRSRIRRDQRERIRTFGIERNVRRESAARQGQRLTVQRERDRRGVADRSSEVRSAVLRDERRRGIGNRDLRRN